MSVPPADSPPPSRRIQSALVGRATRRSNAGARWRVGRWSPDERRARPARHDPRPTNNGVPVPVAVAAGRRCCGPSRAAAGRGRPAALPEPLLDLREARRSDLEVERRRTLAGAGQSGRDAPRWRARQDDPRRGGQARRNYEELDRPGSRAASPPSAPAARSRSTVATPTATRRGTTGGAPPAIGAVAPPGGATVDARRGPGARRRRHRLQLPDEPIALQQVVGRRRRGRSRRAGQRRPMGRRCAMSARAERSGRPLDDEQRCVEGDVMAIGCGSPAAANSAACSSTVRRRPPWIDSLSRAMPVTGCPWCSVAEAVEVGSRPGTSRRAPAAGPGGAPRRRERRRGVAQLVQGVLEMRGQRLHGASPGNLLGLDGIRSRSPAYINSAARPGDGVRLRLDARRRRRGSDGRRQRTAATVQVESRRCRAPRSVTRSGIAASASSKKTADARRVSISIERW